MDSAALLPKIKRNGRRSPYIRLQWNCPFEPDCTDHFDSKAACRAHLGVVHDSLPYRCLVSDCTASFGGTGELSAHITSTHTTRFQCAKCPKSYSTYTRLRDHYSNYHQTGLFQCLSPHCNQIFTNPLQLHNHQRNHSTVTCPTCGKIIKRCSIKEHLKIHTSTERPYKRTYKCPTCKQSFPTKGTLDTHRKLHLGAAPYTCTVCSKVFRQSSYVQVHEEIHRQATLQCEFCQKNFGGHYTLTSHLRYCHRELYTSRKERQKKEEQESFLHNLRLLNEKAAEVQKPSIWRPWS